MSLPPDSEYETYETAMRERYRLWVLYMTKQLEASLITQWPIEPSVRPEPVPFCVWHVRPAGVPDNQPVPLSGWYDSVITISGLQWHRPTGHSTLGKNPHRHGRLNWDATQARALLYSEHARTEGDTHNKKIQEIGARVGNEALGQLPSVDGTDYPDTDIDLESPRWVKVIRLPGNLKWNLPDSYVCGAHYGGPVTLADMGLSGMAVRNLTTVEQALEPHRLTDSCVNRILAQVDMVFLTKLDRARKRFWQENL